MINTGDILETINMIQHEHLDIRTVTMGISLLDCIDSDIDKACDKVYDKIVRYAKDLVPVCEGIEAELVVLDNEGFSTYESLYRAKNDFDADKIIIITQEYHLYRALYIARELGMEAYGVSADTRTYRGQIYRDLREQLARFKDFLQCLIESGK